MDVLLNVFSVILMIWGTALIVSEEDDSILSSKRLGLIVFIFGIILYLMITFLIQLDERQMLLRKCYDNNITLDKKYDQTYDDFKVQDFRKSLNIKEIK